MLSAGSIEERVDAIARRGVSLPDYTEIQITIDDRGLDELASAFGPDEENGSPDYGEILSDGRSLIFYVVFQKFWAPSNVNISWNIPKTTLNISD